MDWFTQFKKDIIKMGFVFESGYADEWFQFFVAKNARLVIRGKWRVGDNGEEYKVDIGVRKHFDRWANSTDWYVETSEFFTAKALMDIVKRFYKQKYYNFAYCDYLNITSNVLSQQEFMDSIKKEEVNATRLW